MEGYYIFFFFYKLLGDLSKAVYEDNGSARKNCVQCNMLWHYFFSDGARPVPFLMLAYGRWISAQSHGHIAVVIKKNETSVLNYSSINIFNMLTFSIYLWWIILILSCCMTEYLVAHKILWLLENYFKKILHIFNVMFIVKMDRNYSMKTPKSISFFFCNFMTTQ